MTTIPNPNYLARCDEAKAAWHTSTAIGYHAEARDENGRSLPDRIWGWDMPVLADRSGVDGLDNLRGWAAAVIDLDPRVARVDISRHLRQPSQCWTHDRHIETVTR